MDDQRRGVNLGFTKEQLPESGHICLIYDSEAQRQKIVSEYLAAGLWQGEMVRYAADVTPPEQVRAWLLELGIELQEGGPFTVFKAESFYCPNGRFDPQEMIAGMLPRFEQVQQAGYSGIRSSGEMSWTLRGIPGSERWLEYEALLNTVGGTFPHTGMCQYDARLFDGAALFQVLQVHPYMIAHGQIVRNPFFIRPEEFLKKIASQQT
jgi:hypothetical protein